MKSAVEQEIKLRMDSPEAARQALVAIGGQRVGERHFEDNLLLDDARRSVRSAGQVLRLRRTPHEARLTLKGRRNDVQGVKTRHEVEFTVSDADAAEEMVRLLGYQPVFRYQKYREVWRWRDAEIVVDETPVGTFIEVEGPLPTIHAAAAALGRRPEDYIRESYVALFFESGGTGDMVFEK